MVGEIVRRKREALGLSQQDVIKQALMKKSNYSSLEAGCWVPVTRTIWNRLSNILGLDIQLLMDVAALDKRKFPSFILEDKDRITELYAECLRRANGQELQQE